MLYRETIAVCSQIHTTATVVQRHSQPTQMSQSHFCHKSANSDWPGIDSEATGRDAGDWPPEFEKYNYKEHSFLEAASRWVCQLRMVCLWRLYAHYLNPILFLRYTLILSLHLYVYFHNLMANVLHFTSPHACYMFLLISWQSSSYNFLRRLPRPFYPQLLFSRRLVSSRAGLDAPFLTSKHGPSCP